jgi:hypothetical protein
MTILVAAYEQRFSRAVDEPIAQARSAMIGVSASRTSMARRRLHLDTSAYRCILRGESQHDRSRGMCHESCGHTNGVATRREVFGSVQLRARK